MADSILGNINESKVAREGEKKTSRENKGWTDMGPYFCTNISATKIWLITHILANIWGNIQVFTDFQSAYTDILVLVSATNIG